MSTCYLHIGMHKTGSSSIQRNLARLLDDDNTIYARFSFPDDLKAYDQRKKLPANHSYLLRSVFSKKLLPARVLALNPVYKEKDSLRKSMRRFFAKHKGKNVLISAEGLVLLKEQELIRLQRFLSRFFDEIQVFAYVREPSGYIPSAYQQVLKLQWKSFNFRDYELNYRSKLEKFFNVFSHDAVHLRFFDPKGFEGNCAVRDFSSWLGLEINREGIENANESLSREAVQIIYAYRYHERGHEKRYSSQDAFYRAERQIMRLVMRVSGNRFCLHRCIIEPILVRNKSDINWLEDKLGVKSFNSKLAEDKHCIAGESDLLQVKVSKLYDLISLFEDEYKLKLDLPSMRACLDKEVVSSHDIFLAVDAMIHAIYKKQSSPHVW